MKKAKILLSLALLLCLISQMFIMPVSADSATISAPSKAYVGETITVTYTIRCDHRSGLGSAEGFLNYSASNYDVVKAPGDVNKISDGKYKFAYYDATGSKSSISYTFELKVKRAGSGGISCTVDEIVPADNSSVTSKSASVGITLIDKSTLSSNANLKKLTISAGKLSPAFDPNVTEYNINVGYTVTRLLITIVTAEEAATNEVQGSSYLTVGTNQRLVIVTAPNGVAKKQYKLNIYRAPQDSSSAPENSEPEQPVNPYEITIAGEKRYIVNDYTGITILDGYVLSKMTINGVEMPVMVDALGEKVIVYATDNQDKTGCYCLYDQEKGEFSIYKIFGSASKDFVILDPEKKNFAVEGYYYTSYTLNGYTVNGYKYQDSDKSNLYIFFGENEQGNKAFYRYDALDSSVQRAVEFTELFEKSTQIETTGTIIDKFNKLDLKYKMVLIAAILLTAVVIALIVISIVRAANRKKGTVLAARHSIKDEYGYEQDDYNDTDIFINMIKDSQSKKVEINDDFLISDDKEDKGEQEE